MIVRGTFTDTAYTPVPQDSAVYVDAGSGGVTITLPTAATQSNRIYYIYKVAGSGNVTIAPDGSDLINGANASKTITTQWSGIRLTNWGGGFGEGLGWIATAMAAV